MSATPDHVSTVRSYFDAIRDDPDAVAGFYSSEVVQDEFPNRFLPNGARRDLKELGEASERGRKVMASQKFTILEMFADGDTVIVEADWSGTLAVPIGEETPAGTVMRARFAQFFRFDANGKIVAQRNYDCFYPW